MNHKVLHTSNNTTTDISDFVAGIQYGGELQSAVRKLEISLLNGTDALIPGLDVRNGGLITLLSGNTEIIRAVIFKQDRDDKGNIKVTGYTHGIYLVKNKDTQIFDRMTASQIARKICNDFGIPGGSIEDTKAVLPRMILRDKTLWDMLITALTETTKLNGKKYRLYFKEGRLNICERAKQLTTLVLESGVNLLAASSSTSIEEMKNRIKVVGKMSEESGKKDLICIVENKEMQKLYGILQETAEESGDKVTQSKLKQVADRMLQELAREEIEADVEAIGVDGIEAGTAVSVIEPVTGLTGIFYVEQDDHASEGNSHTMTLKLKRTDDMPSMEYEG